MKYIHCLFLLLCYLSASAVPELQFCRLNVENSDLSHNYVRAIVKDEDGFVWIATTNGLNRYDGHRTTVYYQGDFGLESSSVYALCSDKSNVLWLKSYISTQYYDKKTGMFVTADTDLFDKASAEENRLKEYFIKNLKSEEKYPGLRLNCFSSDKYGNLWVGTNDGIYVFDQSTKSLQHVHNEKDLFSLSDNRITDIYAGHDGEIWVGTRSGVFYSNRISSKFRKITYVNNVSLKNAYINAFAPDNNGRIWISTENAGIFIYDIFSGNIRAFRNAAVPRRCLNIRIFDRDLWIITANGAVRIDLDSGTSRFFSETAEHKKIGYSRDVCRTSSGKVFIGTHVGLFMLDNETDQLHTVEALSGIYIESLFCDSSGKIWACTSSKGVFCINPDDLTYNHYNFAYKQEGTLPASRIISAYESSEGTMWFCTFGKGICRMNSSDSTFTVYNSSTLQKPHFNDICYSILEDNGSNLWIATNKGIIKFNPTSHSINCFTKEDGLLNSENGPAAKLHLANDDIFYGSADGFTIFNATRLSNESDNIKLIINDLYVKGRKVTYGDGSGILDTHIDLCTQLHLQSSDNSFDFTISVTGSSQSNADIEYRLSGYSDIWQPAGNTDNRIAFTNIPYGKYTLEIRETSTGISRELPIDIDVPVFLRWWAFIIYFFIVTGIITLMLWLIRQKYKRNNEAIIAEMKYRQEKSMLEEKINFLSNIVHEIKTPLTLIKSPLNAIARNYPDNDFIKSNLTVIDNSTNHLTQLTNEMLEYLRLERKGYILENKILDITAVVKEICFDFKERAAESEIDFRYCTECDSVYVEADMSSLRKIINNLLGNAFKYCDRLIDIDIRIREDRNFCDITFRNDGEAIPPEWRERIFKPFMRTDGVKLNESDGIGLGLPLARSLAELNSGSLHLNTESELTEFILSLPCAPVPVAEAPEDGAGRFSILIAEDNTDLRSYIADQLGKEYKVFTVSDGAAAVRCMHKHNIDLLISDVAMPVMSGIELCRTVRDSFDISHVMIIIISGMNDLSLKISCVESGANLYIEKPLDIEYLKVCIKNLLEHRKLLQKTLCNTLTAENGENFDLNRSDREFVLKIESEIMANISNPAYSVTQLEEALCMSSATLLRKFKRLLNTTPNSYIRTKRLVMAAKMLREGESRISEVCFACGFNTTTYFTKCFHDYYGCSPQAYLQNHSNN